MEMLNLRVLLTTINTNNKDNKGVREGDGLWPLLFNGALEKAAREWNKKFDAISGIKLESKGLNINGLVFADDMELLAKNWKEAEQHIKELKKENNLLKLD